MRRTCGGCPPVEVPGPAIARLAKETVNVRRDGPAESNEAFKGLQPARDSVDWTGSFRRCSYAW